MTGEDPFRAIEHNLRVALGLEAFVEFGWVTAMFAVAGAFNGGLPTSTPVGAQIYIVVSFFVTIAVIGRTWQILRAVQERDITTLRRINVRAWSVIAILFSALLPAIYLNVAALLIRERVA